MNRGAWVNSVCGRTLGRGRSLGWCQAPGWGQFPRRGLLLQPSDAPLPPNLLLLAPLVGRRGRVCRRLCGVAVAVSLRRRRRRRVAHLSPLRLLLVLDRGRHVVILGRHGVPAVVLVVALLLALLRRRDSDLSKYVGVQHVQARHQIEACPRQGLKPILTWNHKVSSGGSPPKKIRLFKDR